MNTTSLQNGVGDGGGIMLFGVRLTKGSPSSSSSPFRKSSSMNNLSQLDSPPDIAAGYASDDFVHASGRSRERKRGTPWTEEEHRLFLIGLQQVGKGDWRGISRNFVKTRTPTQVASHAQKYFNRLNTHNGRRRRRTSLFDITSDVAASSNMEEDDQSPTCPLLAAPVSISPLKTFMEFEASPLTLGLPVHQTSHAHSIPLPPSSRLASLKLTPSRADDPLPLSLRLPTGGGVPASSSSSSFQGVPPDSLNSSRDGMISVA